MVGRQTHGLPDWGLEPGLRLALDRQVWGVNITSVTTTEWVLSTLHLHHIIES